VPHFLTLHETPLFSKASSPTAVYIQPPIERVSGLLYPKLKQAGREADRWTPTRVEVKNAWDCTATALCH